jgi:hypothetical protein
MKCPVELEELLSNQDQVVGVGAVLRYMTTEALRWRVASGRWQQPCRGVVVAHSGPLTEKQRLWTVALWAGPDAALAGLTAAGLDGLIGFEDRKPAIRPVYVLAPVGRSVRRQPDRIPVVVHYSTMLGDVDVHPLRRPRRTRIARSLVDAAAWMATDRGARAILAAGVQQRLVRPGDLSRVVDANQRLYRRTLVKETLGDIEGGAQALSELDFTRLVVRQYGLPEPDRQRVRKDSGGKRRYLDAVWEAAKVVVEIDGSQHMEAQQYWDDMNRDNDLRIDGYTVLRFPSWLVRHHPEYVADRIKRAILLVGWVDSGCWRPCRVEWTPRRPRHGR